MTMGNLCPPYPRWFRYPKEVVIFHHRFGPVVLHTQSNWLSMLCMLPCAAGQCAR